MIGSLVNGETDFACFQVGQVAAWFGSEFCERCFTYCYRMDNVPFFALNFLCCFINVTL